MEFLVLKHLMQNLHQFSQILTSDRLASSSLRIISKTFLSASHLCFVTQLYLCDLVFTDVPVESLRLRFALLQSLNNTLEGFFLPLVELRQTHTYQNSIAALLCEAKGEHQLRNKSSKNKSIGTRCCGLIFEAC